MKYITVAVLATFALAACETTIPDDDETPPEVSLRINDGGSKLIGSTNEELELDVGCPPGTSADESEVANYIASNYEDQYIADLNSVYFYDGAPPFKFVLTVGDKGGAARGEVKFNDESISTSNPQGSISITDLAGPNTATYPETITYETGNAFHFRVVETNGDRSDPRTGLIMTFTANSLGSSYRATFRGDDFSENISFGVAWLLPRFLCQ